MEQHDPATGGMANMPPFDTEPDPGAPGAGGEETAAPAPEPTERHRRRERMHDMADRAEERLNQRMHRTAARMEGSADRMSRLVDERLADGSAVAGFGGQMIQTVADLLECGGRYLRDIDLDTLRSDLQRQLRERPLQTLLVVVAAGWVTGKALR